jgi:hypothetical protein
MAHGWRTRSPICFRCRLLASLTSQQIQAGTMPALTCDAYGLKMMMLRTVESVANSSSRRSAKLASSGLSNEVSDPAPFLSVPCVHRYQAVSSGLTMTICNAWYLQLSAALPETQLMALYAATSYLNVEESHWELVLAANLLKRPP